MFGSIEKIVRFGIAAFALAFLAVSGAPEASAQSAAQAKPAVVQTNGSGYGGHYGSGGRMMGHAGYTAGHGGMMGHAGYTAGHGGMMGQGGYMANQGYLMAQVGRMMGHDGSMTGRGMGPMGGRNCGW